MAWHLINLKVLEFQALGSELWALKPWVEVFLSPVPPDPNSKNDCPKSHISETTQPFLPLETYEAHNVNSPNIT